MNILTQKDNKLLNREEIIVEITSKAIPSKIEVAKQIAEKLKKSEENIIIEKIDTQFGNHNFKISAKIYNDAKSKEKYEIITRKERKKIIEEKNKKEDETTKAKKEAEKSTEKTQPEQTKEKENNSDSQIIETNNKLEDKE